MEFIVRIIVTELLLNEIILFFIILWQFCNKFFISTNLALYCAFAEVRIQSLTHCLPQCGSFWLTTTKLPGCPSTAPHDGSKGGAAIWWDVRGAPWTKLVMVSSAVTALPCLWWWKMGISWRYCTWTCTDKRMRSWKITPFLSHYHCFRTQAEVNLQLENIFCSRDLYRKLISVWLCKRNQKLTWS